MRSFVASKSCRKSATRVSAKVSLTILLIMFFLSFDEIDLHGIVDLQAQKAAGFTHVDGDFQESGGVEKTNHFADRHFVVMAVDAPDRVVPLKPDLRRAVLSHFFEQIAMNVDDGVFVVVDVHHRTANARFGDDGLQVYPLEEVAGRFTQLFQGRAGK